MVLNKTRSQIGDGKNTLFWHDLWLGDSPLKTKFPKLFRLCLHPSGTVFSFGFWNGRKWEWSFHWAREFRPHDITEWNNLLTLIDRVNFNPEIPDSFIWTPHKSGVFSVKSFSFEMAKSLSNIHIASFKGLWKGLIPHRIELFSWFAILGKLNTKAKLIHLRIIPPVEGQCALCGCNMETSNHLFIQCPISRSLWCWWLNIWGLQWVFPSDLRDVFIQWLPPHKGAFFKKIWLASFSIIIWTIWKERNLRIFQQKSETIHQLQNLVLLRMCWWIKGWGDPFPYNPNEVLRNPTCLQWGSSKKTPGLSITPYTIADWAPPAENALKWNVDASYHPSSRKSAIGGVLRDSKGNFICVFSSPIPCMEINPAEIYAIHRAIQVSLNCSNTIGNRTISVESDSANAVKWCNEKSGGPWNVHFIINFIRNNAAAHNIEISHKSRASNMVADCLAKQGLNREDDFIAWM
ncbi:uncharacterized protein [Spinacia oleracea]|uniref:RNase H type-1 domain-containing protein n=1 Tax=Spinacia oleracea TaxID=3562 RepID=A0ABM3R811_SPIOL|nr:uncharacterized protein LOC130467315 [Spinacia oleracea]